MIKSTANSIFNIPSPITKVETSWSKKYNVEFSIKRDDQIHPIISGNKWRKLSGILNRFEGDDINTIETYGGAYSNHLIATAAVSAHFNISCTGFVMGERPKILNAVLESCLTFGMKLVFLNRVEYRKRKYEYRFSNGTLTIPEGGFCIDGTTGCKNIIEEISESKYNRIYVSCGTGTTYAGMHQALLNKDKLVGVQVLKGKEYLKGEIRETFNISNPNILDDYHFGGYGRTSAALIQFVKEFRSETGIMLDPIYNAKTFYTIKELCNAEQLTNKSILAIHTGGLTGWVGKWKELGL